MRKNSIYFGFTFEGTMYAFETLFIHKTRVRKIQYFRIWK